MNSDVPEPNDVDVDLELKTQVYWNMSRSFNGRSQEPITADRAFKSIHRVLSILNPYRPLSNRFRQIKEEIILGGSRIKPPKIQNTVAQLDAAKRQQS